jgi:hypothetical protein
MLPTHHSYSFIDTHGYFSAFFVVFAADCALLACPSAVPLLKTCISNSMEYSRAYVSDFGATPARC